MVIMQQQTHYAVLLLNARVFIFIVYSVPSTPPATSSTPVPNLTDIPMPPSTKQAEQPDSRIDPVIDDEVAHFLAVSIMLYMYRPQHSEAGCSNLS